MQEEMSQAMELFERLLEVLDVEHGFPSTAVHTSDGIQHGPVTESLAIIVEDILEWMEEMGYRELGDDYH